MKVASVSTWKAIQIFGTWDLCQPMPTAQTAHRQQVTRSRKTPSQLRFAVISGFRGMQSSCRTIRTNLQSMSTPDYALIEKRSRENPIGMIHSCR